jgi:hypothetical protein
LMEVDVRTKSLPWRVSTVAATGPAP